MKCRIFRTDSIGDFDILLPIVVEQANEHRAPPSPAAHAARAALSPAEMPPPAAAASMVASILRPARAYRRPRSPPAGPSGAHPCRESPLTAGSDAPTVKAPPCALAVRWRLHRSQSLPHHGASGSGVWRTLPPPAGGVNGRPRCSSDPDGLLPRQDGSLGAQCPLKPSPAPSARHRTARIAIEFRGNISPCDPPSALSAISLTVPACPHPMAGQLPPQPPSEAAWARARAVDAPVDLGSSRRVRLRSSAIRRTTAAWEGMPAGSPGASRATRAVLRDPGLSWVQWATSVRLGASYSSVVRACVRVAHHAHVRVLRALRGVVRCF